MRVPREQVSDQEHWESFAPKKESLSLQIEERNLDRWIHERVHEAIGPKVPCPSFDDDNSMKLFNLTFVSI